MSTISRQKLIEELERIKHDFWYEDCLRPDHDCHREDDCTTCAVERMREFIESQPPADQWIPCSRELPKQNQHIIGTFENDEGTQFVCDETYFPQLLTEPWKLIAWMPLPEPYKGE